MNNRYEKIGIKQVIRLEWMDKTLDMLLAQVSTDEIRSELKEYLANKKQSGGEGERGEKTYIMAIGILMQSWCNPASEIIPLRDDALTRASQIKKENRLFLHWAMICAAYPFWTNVAIQTGRLLNLQDQITQKQIINRLKEQYGDRQTISRYARYVIRSFVSWGVLKDSKNKGCYERGVLEKISDYKDIVILLEGGLLASPDRRSDLFAILSSPMYFPFNLPPINEKYILDNSPRLSVVNYGLNNQLLQLNTSVES